MIAGKLSCSLQCYFFNFKHGVSVKVGKNMAKLAKTVYKCDAKKVKGIYGILSDKK